MGSSCDVSSLAEARWALHSNPAGGNAAGDCLWHEVPVGHGLRPPGPGSAEHPGQQQPHVQSLGFWLVTGAGGRPRSRLHHKCEFVLSHLNS